MNDKDAEEWVKEKFTESDMLWIWEHLPTGILVRSFSLPSLILAHLFYLSRDLIS